MLRFDDQVVVITGAGGGLGREYALAFAARGAKVVVNDMLKTDEGYAAELVVQEIRKSGGTAIANLESVENAEGIVQTALKEFGRIDVLVNNAGILRDRAFANMTEAEWVDVQKVHNLAVFRLTKHAWPAMREQKYGRLLFIASSAGLFGSFGQTNYSAAKMSVYGMARTLALEGARHGIQANVIAPMAASRMTQSLMREEDLARLSPSDVAPFVLWLTHRECPENGATFYLGGGWCSPVRVLIGDGVYFRDDQGNLNLENIRDRWNEMKNVPTTTEMQSAGQAYTHLVEQLDKAAERSKRFGSYDEVIGTRLQGTVRISKLEASLYALAIGASLGNTGDLKFLYENHPEFSPLPTCLVPKALQVCTASILEVCRQLGANPLRIVHGEHFFEIRDYATVASNIDSESEFSVRITFDDIIDKGKGVLIILKADLFANNGSEAVATNQFCFFQVGSHGKSLKSKSELQIPLADSSAFTGKPDFTTEERTSVDQGALYRLTGDLNPLHIDPDAAQAVNFPKPILHGLCTFGFVVRHVLATFANNQAAAFKAVKVRFSKPVIAGQTIRTEMWLGNASVNSGVKRVFVQCTVVETGEICLANSYVDLLAQHCIVAKSKF